MIKDLKLNSKIGAAAGALFFLVMASLGGLLYRNLAQWRAAEREIAHSRDSIRSYEEIYSQVLAAESAVRAYVITANPQALRRYDAAVSALQREARFLARMEAEHPAQLARLAELNRLTDERRAVMTETVLAKRAGAGSARLASLTNRGAPLTAGIARAVRAMHQAERLGMASLDLDARAAESQRDRLLAAFLLVIALVVIGALGASLRSARKRRTTEEALADEHSRLRSVLDAANRVSIIATDLKGTITLFNRGAERLLGYRAEEVVNLKTPELIHLPAEVAARGKELSEKAGRQVLGFDVFVESARQGGFDSREWTYAAKNGRLFPVELVVTAIKDHLGNLTGFLGVATDISARKASQLQMRKLSAAVKASPTSIVITDRDGYIEYANPKFFELTGYTESELLGRNPKVIASGKTPESVYKEMWDTLIEGRVWTGELLNKKKNGELFWEHASISPVKNPEGEITNFVAVKLDITDRKLAQKEIEKARDAAVELARLKSEFLANMSHEIRTPMNAIIGMTGLLLDTPLTGQQRDYVRTVNGAGGALLDIINDILDFSKIESGKLTIEKTDFNLPESVESTADLLAPRAQAKEIELAYFIDKGVPPALRGDQGRLRQVLLNLLANAVKFTDKGEVVLRVAAEEQAPGAVTLKFSIKDTGIGIPPAAQQNLFQVFTQADSSTTRKYGGTGLGLSISKRLVELMGGRIGLESEPGKGSTFWFSLPFEIQPGAQPAPAPQAADVAGARALIVDDNAANREIVSRYLEAWKMPSAEVSSGAEALALLRREAQADPFKLAILDMQMPRMDGLMLAAEIKKDPALAGLRMVMMTSLGHEIRQEELDAAGISACLGKPVRPLALLKKISQALAGPASAPAPAAAARPAEAGEINKYFRVLVAEDNTVNQKVALKQLEKLGYEGDVAANGLEAIEALKRRPYDLVLMDCQMPEMDGFQATAEIRRAETDKRHTPIVAMTASAMQGDREKCLAAGMDGYISKPVHLEQLAQTLAQWDTPLDASVIRDLADLAGPENPGFLAELARTYLGDLPGRLEAIKAAVKSSAPEALRQAAHSLKGSSGNLGAQRVQKICLQLEGAGKAGSFDGTAELLAALDKEAAAASAALENLAGDGQPK